MPEVCGIVAEYNPFHNGHRRQIEILRRDFGAKKIVAVMSGNFTQRGRAAILPKDVRARLAVANGVDLVVELPVVFSVRSAQDFARGGVNLLAALGVDAVAFGAECGDLSVLQNIAAAVDNPLVQNNIGEKIKAGQSYATAVTFALRQACNVDEALLRAPNNILAIEYLRALKKIPAVLPLLIKREHSRHDDAKVCGEIASGKAIRAATLRGAWKEVSAAVSPDTFAALRTRADVGFFDDERLFLPLLYKLYTSAPADLEKIYGINEGLQYKFLRGKFADAAAMTEEISGKRYPKSRIRRAMLHILLNFTAARAAEFDTGGAAYIRPLAFNETGREILRRIKAACPLPIIHRVAKFMSEKGGDEFSTAMLAFDVLASDLFGLCAAPIIPAGADFLQRSTYYQRGNTDDWK